MKLSELKQEIQQYQYLEDTHVIDVALASIVATRLKLGDPVWLVIIGASSGGKSQILRPLALTDKKFMLRVDDLTENTLLSGTKVSKEDKKKNVKSPSMLHRIGPHGMMVLSDLTVLFSKSPESRATILSQFRMLYDGEMTKYSGNNPEPLFWEGYLGVLAGSTPSLYRNFEEVADMGERFVYYRMKEYDGYKATKLALSRDIYGSELDDKLSGLYNEYLMDVIKNRGDEEVVLSEENVERIIRVAELAERIRTAVHTDFKGEVVTKIPVSAMPMRVALQLMNISKGLAVINHHENGSFDLSEENMLAVEWCGYSLANEEKRNCLRTLASVDFGDGVTRTTVSDKLGLNKDVTELVLQNLVSVGVIGKMSEGGLAENVLWHILKKSDWETIRRMEGIEESLDPWSREQTFEE